MNYIKDKAVLKCRFCHHSCHHSIVISEAS